MSGGETGAPTQGAIEGGDRAEHVLVLGGSMDGDVEDYCAERISSPAGTGSSNALLITLDETPDRRFDTVVRHGMGQPANVGIVCCDQTRSTASTQPTHGPEVGPGPWITTVSSPGDLTGLGLRIQQALSAWADEPGPIELCFHSLTTLCQSVDERAVFRFCHTVTRHLDASGASAHFHLDPEAVDEQTVAMLSALFDRVEDCT